MMKRVLMLLLLFGVLAFSPCRAFAAAAEDFAEAQRLYFMAVTSMGAYQDRIGNLAFTALEQDGWKLKAFKKSDLTADAKFFMMRMNGEDGYPDYLLSVAGTENGKDISTDLRWGKVPYGGAGIAEFEAYSKRKDLSAEVPRVHDGFNQYVQVLLSLSDDGKNAAEAKDRERTVVDRLREDKGTEIMLVGHSLGGAAATLLAARLIDLGIPSEKIKVVTFGAPAVGNAAFAELQKDRINLKRYINVGDPVPHGLSTLVGGYQQFGYEEHWQVPKTVNAFPHKMAVYLDYALKNYFDKRKALETETKQKVSRKGMYKTNLKVKGYVAPLHNELQQELDGEFYYMQKIMEDQVWRTFPDAVIAERELSFEEHLRKAKEEGCEVVLLPTASSKRIKSEGQQYYVQLRLLVYSAFDGRLLGGYVYSSNTREFTPAEAFLSNVRNMTRESGEWVKHLPEKNENKGQPFNLRLE